MKNIIVIISVFLCFGCAQKKHNLKKSEADLSEEKVSIHKEDNSALCQLNKNDTIEVKNIIKRLRNQCNESILKDIVSEDFSFQHSFLCSSMKEAFLYLNKGEIEFLGEERSLIISVNFNYSIEEIEDEESNSSEKTLILYFECKDNQIKLNDLSVAG